MMIMCEAVVVRFVSVCKQAEDDAACGARPHAKEEANLLNFFWEPMLVLLLPSFG